MVTHDTFSNMLREMDWKDFELLVGEIFRIQGYSVVETGGGADGGIDLILKKDNELILVQCKQWRAYKVSVNVVRELLGVMVTKGAAGGFVVTSGIFTAEAQSFAKGQNIDLIDGIRLTAMIEKITKDNSNQTANKLMASLKTLCLKLKYQRLCRIATKCGRSMVKRIAQKGANAGSRFWGCSSFPICRGIRVNQ